MSLNKKLIWILFLLWILSLSFLLFLSFKYKLEKTYLELKLFNYSCDKNSCQISFGVKNYGTGYKTINYFITLTERETRYMIKEGYLEISSFDERVIEEEAIISNFRERPEVIFTPKYEVHFFDEIANKTVKIGVEIV